MASFQEIIQSFKGARAQKAVQLAGGLWWTVFLAYITASTAASSLVWVLGDMAVDEKFGRNLGSAQVKGTKKELNYRTLRKKVKGRNIFNSEGEFPDEEDPVADKEEKTPEDTFDPRGPCKKSRLNVDLLGTIFMGQRSPSSLATIREKGYNVADIYRIGDVIIENPDAEVFDILPKRVVLNNAGAKECLELKEKKLVDKLTSGFSSKPKAEKAASAEPSGEVVLSAREVVDALGPGYSSILREGRLVPHSVDNRLVGYKLVGVKANSLYTKLGLGSGDVITNVNGITMTKAEQGFALYQALSEEREIRLEYLKKGDDPTTINIEIK